MTLGNFNVLIYPDKKIVMDFWLNTEGGSRQLLVIPQEEHGLNYDDLQAYLTTIHTKLAESAKVKPKKKHR
jgi:hypothetical protein